LGLVVGSGGALRLRVDYRPDVFSRAEVEGLKTFVRSGQEAVTAIKQDAEAIKTMPVVRSYVEDPVSALVRPECDKDRVVYVPDPRAGSGPGDQNWPVSSSRR